MIWQRINRSDAEKVFGIFQNVAGTPITANYPAVWDVSAPDGVRVSKPATATLGLFVGVANRDVADFAKLTVNSAEVRTCIVNRTLVVHIKLRA